MKIAIVSDTHGRHATVEKALRLLDEHGIQLILHCGDIDDADTVWLFPPNTRFVFGNCDRYELTALRQAMHGIGATCDEYLGTLELAGKRIAFLHGDDQDLLDDLEHSGHFDYIFHGHTHVAGERRRGPTRIINPGALHRARIKTFAVLDLESGELHSVVVDV